MKAEEIAALAAAVVELIREAGTIGVDLYLKLEQIFELGPDEKTNIKAQVQAAIDIDQDTIDRIDAWKKEHGFE